mmetsp:Transcript_4772/g.11391  ORF Transcript_4772/g.11391 Transcript_4772/m.11391 type:complete len:255 (+) Transcript_4772:299-1063(+)|eukprot:CAMPEP_0116097782 /NCGR_PEP_ID=MMETSP0327-20121206/10886_1 /TAXON_ID=44447 /ORGANISM="Pseudo-nitzschia delicatissima, Strain B596" /LENGTH=254 /DNA_ID=CAMNT_0003589551 /DNA_START=296 /DNA_END=1060 /DNA_ORIENTATION=-
MTKTSTSNETKAAGSVTHTVKRGRKGLRCRNLSNEQRVSLLQSLLKNRASAASKNSKGKSKSTTSDANDENNVVNNKLRKGALLEASKAFGVSTKTCKRIWERFLETSDASGSGGDVSHRKHQSGRPKKISAEDLVNKIMELPPETRSSVRGLARALGMPHTTIHRRLKSGEIKLKSLLSAHSEEKEEEKKEESPDAEKENGNSAKARKLTSNLKSDKSIEVLSVEKENKRGSNISKPKAKAKSRNGNSNSTKP